jgi:hypothetical protein
VKGNLLSWSPYLLKLFPDDCKDAQDLWNKVPLCMTNYFDSFGGLGRTQIQQFYLRLGKCCATTYITLRHISYEKERKENSSIFSMYFDEMKENIANT